jgi:hypothetical protein
MTSNTDPTKNWELSQVLASYKTPAILLG